MLTDDDPSQIDKAKGLVNYLNQFDFPGLMLEAVNEAFIHDKVDPAELKNTLSASKYLYGSGIYNDLKKFWGKVGYYHHPRKDEWPRTAKDTIECWQGGGPNFPDEPACKVPWIHDEIIRPDQAGFNNLDFYTFGALASIMSAGVTFHCDSAKLGKLPTEQEYGCYKDLMLGMSIFPEDVTDGSYSHHKELEEIDPITNEPTACLRIFSVNRFVVIVRNKHVKVPSHWKPLDNYKVCYEIS